MHFWFCASGDVFVIEPLDYEASHEYYITIEATDGGSPPLSDMATVNINLTDVNDNRPVFSQDVYTAVISEDAELGKTVMAVRAHALSLVYSRCSLWGNNCKGTHRVRDIFHLSLWTFLQQNLSSCSPSHSVAHFLPRSLSLLCPLLTEYYHISAPVANHHLVERLN